MKTWEMIKELTENPNKKFKLKGEENEIYTSDREGKDGIDLIDIDFITIHDEWEEVKEPVSFMEAVKSDKRIRVEHKLVNDSDIGDLITFTPLDCLICALGEEYNKYEVKDILLNGEWYIEDQELIK